jgi:hypothetical protein
VRTITTSKSGVFLVCGELPWTTVAIHAGHPGFHAEVSSLRRPIAVAGVKPHGQARKAAIL